MKSGEFFEFNVQHVFDRPTEDFELIDDIYIPMGEYWDTRYEVIFSSFKGRDVSTGAYVNIGEFYTGQRQEYAIVTNINFNKHLNISFDWKRNYIKLPTVSATTDEIGGRIDYSFNPKLQTGIFAQWNNELNNILINYRINWIPKIGSFFYLVINQEFGTDNTIKLERTTIIGKFIWRFSI